MLDFILIVSGILLATGLVLVVVSLFVDEWRGVDLCELGVKSIALGAALALVGGILLPPIYYSIA